MATPARSRRVLAPRDSDSFHQANGTSTAPTGTLSQKMYCQDQPVVTAPPTRGPTATAVPPIAPQIPSAAFRRSGGTAALSSVSDSGMIMAPPAPCRARAMISRSMFGASAAAADAAVNKAMPITKIRRRPNRSPMAAAESRSTAKVSVYALTVHSSPERPAWRWIRMTGRAVEVVQRRHEQGHPGDGHRPDRPGAGSVGRRTGLPAERRRGTAAVGGVVGHPTCPHRGSARTGHVGGGQTDGDGGQDRLGPSHRASPAEWSPETPQPTPRSTVRTAGRVPSWL
jgi:hypothetical protein